MAATTRPPCIVLSCRPNGYSFSCRVFGAKGYSDFTSAREIGSWKVASIGEDGNLLPTGQGLVKQGASLKKLVEKDCKALELPPWHEDACMRALMPKIREAAEYAKLQVLSGRPLFIRFNADTDGITAGLFVKWSLEEFAKSKGLECRITDVPSPPAIYEKVKANAEMRYFEEMGQEPLCILVDHAANTESVAALQKIKALGFPVMILDHHPPAKDINELCSYFISPFAVGVAESRYTAGLLCFEFAKAVCGKADELALSYALTADASTLARSRDYTAPLAIDYYAQSNPGARLLDYSKLIQSKGELERLYLVANRLLDQAKEEALANAKVETGRTHLLCVTDLNGVVKKRSFPSKGIVLNLVQKAMEERAPGKPVVSACYVGDSVGFRANRLALEAGFDANKLIASIKDSLPRCLKSGGGHSAAASLQVADESDRLRVRELALSIARDMLTGSVA